MLKQKVKYVSLVDGTMGRTEYRCESSNILILDICLENCMDRNRGHYRLRLHTRVHVPGKTRSDTDDRQRVRGNHRDILHYMGNLLNTYHVQSNNLSDKKIHGRIRSSIRKLLCRKHAHMPICLPDN